MSEKEKGSFSRALSETENGFAFFWHNKGGFIIFFFLSCHFVLERLRDDRGKHFR